MSKFMKMADRAEVAQARQRVLRVVVIACACLVVGAVIGYCGHIEFADKLALGIL